MKFIVKLLLCFLVILGLIINIVPIIIGLLYGLVMLILGFIIRNQYVKEYGWNILISYDQVGNTILLGDPDETISSRTGKVENKYCWAKALSWFLNKLDPNHCKKSIEIDEGKDQIL